MRLCLSLYTGGVSQAYGYSGVASSNIGEEPVSYVVSIRVGRGSGVDLLLGGGSGGREVDFLLLICGFVLGKWGEAGGVKGTCGGEKGLLSGLFSVSGDSTKSGSVMGDHGSSYSEAVGWLSGSLSGML